MEKEAIIQDIVVMRHVILIKRVVIIIKEIVRKKKIIVIQLEKFQDIPTKKLIVE